MVKQGHDVTIIAAELYKFPQSYLSFFGKDNIDQRDLAYTESTGVKIIRLPISRFVSSRAFFTKELQKTVNNIHPDILYIHQNDSLTAMKYILKIRKLNFPIITDSHMLQMAARNPLNRLFKLYYRTFITPIIKKHKLIVIRTQDDDYVQKYLGIPLNQSPWISVGSDTLLFHPDERIRGEFREQHGIRPDDFVVVYTGKMDETKGGLLLAEAFREKFESDKTLILIVVGNTSGEYGAKVDEVFSQSQNRIIRYPTQKYVDLPKFYQAADLSVFPMQCSLSFYDAQACGLPVVSENNNINFDRLKMNNGMTFNAGDVEDFRDKITYYMNMNPIEYSRIKENAQMYVQQNFDYEQIAEEYTNILVNEYKRFNNGL